LAARMSFAAMAGSALTARATLCHVGQARQREPVGNQVLVQFTEQEIVLQPVAPEHFLHFSSGCTALGQQSFEPMVVHAQVDDRRQRRGTILPRPQEGYRASRPHRTALELVMVAGGILEIEATLNQKIGRVVVAATLDQHLTRRCLAATQPRSQALQGLGREIAERPKVAQHLGID
jgi:hypothetical protein